MFAARDVFWHRADKIRSGLMVTNPGHVPFRTSPHVANHRIGRRCRSRINPVDQALRRTDLGGSTIKFKALPFQKGTIIAGVLFGTGWAITGACPGPIYAHLGSGEPLSLLSFAGVFVGAYIFAIFKSKLPH